MVNDRTPSPAPHLAEGKRGEDVAAQYLRRKGYEVLGRNIETGRGEVDIIARLKDTIVFVEVKARSSADGFDPSGRVDHGKIRRLLRAAEVWLSRRTQESPARIDVIGVQGGEVVEHFEDVTA